MRNEKVIAHTKKDENLFILEPSQSRKAMATIKTVSIWPRAMAMTRQDWPTHLISQNKRICLWYRHLVHISNAQVVRASRLTDGTDLNTKDKEYNPVEVLIMSDKSNVSDLSDSKELPDVCTTLVCQIRAKDILDKLYEPCIGSKSTRVVRCNKSMIVTTDKLEEVHNNLWGPHNLPLQSRSSYAAILLCEHTRKTWTLYLWGKDDFVDTFQAWLPYMETKSNRSMKVLQVDRGGEFIFAKLQTFYKRHSIAIKYIALYIYKKNGLAKRGWRTIVMIKDSILINSNLLNDF